ncbi:hypothetical protein C8F01DRAFT_1002508 [Mycena amicta]|nr:hypothetical protein C8F01DRAFT_1002508 [Mycena amicta]
MNEAAEFVLAGTTTTRAITAAANTPLASSSPSDVKQEPGVSAILESINGLIKVLTAQQQLAASPSAPRQNQHHTHPPGANCNMCGDDKHFIRDCAVVDDYTKLGKCKRDVNGRVTLPSGAFVPLRTPGTWLRDRIDEWHRQNPGQMAAAQLILDLAPQSAPNPAASTVASTFILCESDRIQSLERELFALRTRAQARAAIASGEPTEPPEQPFRSAPAPVNAPEQTEAPPVVPRILPRPAAAPVPSQPQHPFASARDAAYAPPRDRNVGVRVPNPPAAKKPEVAYRTTAPVYDEKIASEVFGCSMDAPITLTQRELLSLSPEVRAQVRDATTSRRVAPNAKQAANASDPDARNTAFFDSMPATFTQSAQQQLPPNAFIVPDPFESYYAAGELPKDLIVSLESSAIRSILGVVDNQQQIEGIVDGGSGIVSMSDAVCHELGLAYDPRIVLQMQSANGAVNPSLGLARNVPYRIGDITLYLQFHIVHNPPYDILLGRPFDVLTESVVRNYADEQQTITIRDPNTGQVATVPTLPRGPPRSRRQGF